MVNVKDTEAWGHVYNLTSGERAGAAWLCDLLFFEATQVIINRGFNKMRKIYLHGGLDKGLHIDLRTHKPVVRGCEGYS